MHRTHNVAAVFFFVTCCRGSHKPDVGTHSSSRSTLASGQSVAAAPTPLSECEWPSLKDQEALFAECPPSWQRALEDCEHIANAMRVRVIEHCHGFNEYHLQRIAGQLRCYYDPTTTRVVGAENRGVGDVIFADTPRSKVRSKNSCTGVVPSVTRDGCIAKWCGPPPLPTMPDRPARATLEATTLRANWEVDKCPRQEVLDCVLSERACQSWNADANRLCARGWSELRICEGRNGKRSILFGREGLFFYDRGTDPISFKGMLGPELHCLGTAVTPDEFESDCTSYSCQFLQDE